MYGIVLLLTVVACDEQESQWVLDNSDLKNRSNSVIIYGTWVSPCEQVNTGYVQAQLSFDNGLILQKIQFHPDANCIVAEKQATLIAGGYTIGKEVLTPSGITAREIDITIVEDENEVNYLNLFYLQSDVLYMGIIQSDQTRPPDIDLNYLYYRKFSGFITLSPGIDLEYKTFYSPQKAG